MFRFSLGLLLALLTLLLLAVMPVHAQYGLPRTTAILNPDGSFSTVVTEDPPVVYLPPPPVVAFVGSGYSYSRFGYSHYGDRFFAGPRLEFREFRGPRHVTTIRFR